MCGLAGALAPDPVGGIDVALALVASADVLVAAASYVCLPETRGLELEAIASEVA
jgi:hypothetical protein